MLKCLKSGAVEPPLKNDFLDSYQVVKTPRIWFSTTEAPIHIAESIVHQILPTSPLRHYMSLDRNVDEDASIVTSWRNFNSMRGYLLGEKNRFLR